MLTRVGRGVNAGTSLGVISGVGTTTTIVVAVGSDVRVAGGGVLVVRGGEVKVGVTGKGLFVAVGVIVRTGQTGLGVGFQSAPGVGVLPLIAGDGTMATY